MFRKGLLEVSGFVIVHDVRSGLLAQFELLRRTGGSDNLEMRGGMPCILDDETVTLYISLLLNVQQRIGSHPDRSCSSTDKQGFALGCTVHHYALVTCKA